MLLSMADRVKFAALRASSGAQFAQFSFRMAAMPTWRIDRLAHRALPLVVALDADDDAVVYISLGARLHGLVEHARRNGARMEAEVRKTTPARAQLREYLRGMRTAFDLRTRPHGTTFQRRAWQALTEIPFGKTWSYATQAKAVGNVGGARAVGRANGANPIPIVIPCHRVLGSSGSMVGFSGGGVETKRWLLALEREGRAPEWTPAERSARRASEAQLGLFA